MVWDALDVAMSLDVCLSLSADVGSAHRGREEWWNCERVKESSVHVVSISVCLEINGGLSTEYPLRLHFSGLGETGHRSVHLGLSLTVRLCGNCYTWTCVPWVCRPCALDKIFFWWPARVTPILANSLEGKGDKEITQKCFGNTFFTFTGFKQDDVVSHETIGTQHALNTHLL